VIVCDGFVGNIVLKVSEGLAEQLMEQFRGTVEAALRAVPARAPSMVEVGPGSALGSGDGGGLDPVGFLDRRLRSSIGSLKERIDFAEYGGAPLLGVKGVVIIAHGRSEAKAITNAVRVARRMVETDINRHITEEIHTLSKRG
jgi:glycerol-3-phosphate acyltransferase PlsX